MEERTIVYFDAPGPQNTGVVLACALRRAKEKDIRYIVVASSSGETALRLGEEAKREGYQGKIVVCTYHAGFSGGDAISLPLERRALLEAMGMVVVQGVHALSGISRSFRQRFGGLSIPEIVAESFRRISEGFKVAIEVAIMAADFGAIPTTEDVIALGGKEKGVDTAIVLRPCHQNSFFDLKVREILCMPRL
ncbi:MAG: pyruvate kinase alpha/beta domain-containing protein [Atribacterota bacterium]